MLHGGMPRFPAFFTSILRERSLCIALLAAGLVLVGANLLHWRVWTCAFRETTGLPCPGCGMTRALSALCRGQFTASWALHPFAPGIALGGVLLLLATLLPAGPRQHLLAVVETIERRTGITMWFIVAMLVWGVWRMLTHEADWMPPVFFR